MLYTRRLYTRRDIGKLALTAVPLAALAAKPESKYGGVQVGTISYSFREMPEPNNCEALLKHMTDLGLNGIELMNAPAETFAGAPVAQRMPAGPPPPPGAPRTGPTPLTPEQQAALKKWRLGVSMDKYKALRKMYNDAGVDIYAFKLGLTMAMSNEEYEYTFNVAEALGANHLTMELPEDGALTKRVGEFAAKRKMYVGYHAHTQATPTIWDQALSQSKYNGINLDLGHYTAGTSGSPIPFLQKNHGRITSMHMKDRKYETHGGDNLPWGQGDTPIKEALQLMKKEHYTFPATIELEYKIPAGSNVMAEMRKCVQYCKDALA